MGKEDTQKKLNLRCRKGKDEDLFQWVEEEAKRRRVDKSDILREALIYYIEAKEEGRC